LPITVDGKPTKIRSDGFQHFFILNSEFYGQALDRETIKRLYDNFRSLLVHNASLAPSSFLWNNPDNDAAFPMVKGRCWVNVPGFLAISRKAVSHFLPRVDQVVPTSNQAANIARRK
jgi:hypothetical protein